MPTMRNEAVWSIQEKNLYPKLNILIYGNNIASVYKRKLLACLVKCSRNTSVISIITAWKLLDYQQKTIYDFASADKLENIYFLETAAGKSDRETS